MESNKAMGYSFLVVGLGVLLFTVYLGYTFYQSDVSHAYSATGGTPSGTLPSGILGIFFTSSIESFLFLVIAVLILLVLASVGGRLIVYGMNLLDLYDHGTAEEAKTASSAQRTVGRVRF